MCILLAATVLAAVPSPVSVPGSSATLDVPQDKGQQEVQVLTREFPVGGSSGWHTHPGIEIGHVVSGVTEMRAAGMPARRYAAGETFVIPRGVVHNGVNVGQEPVRLVITYVIDKGAPVRSPAADPAASDNGHGHHH